ncbi:MAG: hypothetical protein M3220_05705 [Chloroflexota bacterium]|nr:hypothetical protein [Chloroflexota bacterium]
METNLQELIGVLLPVWLPIGAAPIIYLMRRQALLAALPASGVMGMTGWWLATRPPQHETFVLGRSLFLSSIGQVVLVALAFWLVFAFLYSWRISQGWSLFPFLLLVYGGIAAALFFEDLVLQVLLLKLAWLFVIILVQGGAGANTRAATRLLILSVVALPPFLVAATLIGQQVSQPDVPMFTALIVLMLGIGFALMLAVIPFHAWLPQTAEDGPPLIAAWLVAGMGSAYLVLLFDLLTRYEWLAQDVQLQQLLFAGGLLLALAGGILIVTEQHLGRLWAYAVLTDLGYILLGLSFNSSVGRVAVLLLIGGRLVSLLVSGSALATMRHRATSLHFDDLVGVGARLPLSMLVFAIGGLALLGAPLTAGFPGHWTILRLMAEGQSPWLWALLVTSVLGMIGFIRAFAVMVAPTSEERLLQVEGEPRIATSLLLGLSALSLLVGLAPQSLDPLLAHLLGSLNF